MNTTDHVFEETKIAGQSRCVAETLTCKRVSKINHLIDAAVKEVIATTHEATPINSQKTARE